MTEVITIIREEKTMINLKTIISTVLAAAFCIIPSAPAAAEQPLETGIERYADTDGFDTLSFTQTEYEGLVSGMISDGTANAYCNSAAISDMQIIEEICKVHIATSRAFVRDPDSYSKTTFFSPEAGEKQLVKNHVSQYDYLNALYEAKGWTFRSDRLSFSGFQAEIDGDYANASIVEEYSYDIDNGFDKMCWLSREYSVNLHKSLGNWYITCITTDSPIEKEEIDVEAEMAFLSQTTETTGEFDDLDINNATVPMSSSLYTWKYNADDAVEYAETYYKDANPLFGENDADCQNFVSQCVWAGLGGTKVKSAPSVSIDMVGKESNKIWCHNQFSSCYSDYRYNWAWDNVVGFFHLLEISSPETVGPYGNTYVSNALKYARAGDPLFVNTNGGAATVTNINHAMFITDVQGTYGDRTPSDIFIAAHNQPTDTAYQTLSEYLPGSLAKSYARATMICGYYQTQQP